MSYSPGQPSTSGQPPPSYEPSGEPETLYGQAAQPYAQPQSNVPPVPGSAPPQPKKPYRRPWISLGIIFAALILVYAVLMESAILSADSTTAPARTVVEHYYDAVESQNYAQAYSYLDIQTITASGKEQQATQALYTQVAQALDQLYGKVTYYNIINYTIINSEISFSTDSGYIADIPVVVTRVSDTQVVHVQLRQVGNDWKIIEIPDL